jgi:hypothetical protein
MKSKSKSIDTTRFFSIVYETKDHRTETYICRSGVTQWKTMDGNLNWVQGVGATTPRGIVRLYCANRKGYRMFDLKKIKQVRQGKKVLKSLRIKTTNDNG